jgi:translation initiation factor IF-1
MSKEISITMSGTVTDVDRGSVRVQLDSGHSIRATIAGKLLQHRIRVFVNDRVNVECTPYDLTKGRVIYRFNRL